MILIIIIVLINIIALINIFVINKTNKFFYEKNADVIIIMGANKKDDKDGNLLIERLNKGIELYNNGISNKILIIGTDKYGIDETKVMFEYLLNNNIPEENIIVDSKSDTTYDSIYRISKIYEVKNAVIVTQKYHLYRTLYLAYAFDIDAYGVYPSTKTSVGIKRNTKEIILRVKDFIYSIIKPQTKYLGEITPINSGDDNE